ncbi:MAG: hypothetical protein ACI4Q6_03200 [Huintestinicola sp.]
MNKIFKAVSAAAASIALSAAMAFSVSAAQDYEFDVSGAIKTAGDWKQSYTESTPLVGDAAFADNFDPRWMTPDSEVLVEFEVESIPNGYPCELIWQTWGDSKEVDPNIKQDWTKIVPDEATETTARFTYESIVEAYGTDDFSKVYAIHIGDVGSPLLVTKLTVTNIQMDGAAASEETAEETTESETEAVSEVTEAPASETSGLITATSSIADNAPDESGISATAVIVIVVVIVIAAAAAFVIIMIKKSKNSMY